MVDIIKKDMTDIWAVAGDVVAPDSAKVRGGWGVEVVPRQWWNWFENRQDTNIAYMLQKGIPEWDQFTEYLTNKSYVQRNNIVYKCILTGVNKDPATTPANWVKAFPESTAYLEHIKSLPVTVNTLVFSGGNGQAQQAPIAAYGLSLLNLTSAAAGRTLLDAQQANSNLTALSGVGAATNVLPYFTSGTAMAGTTITNYARTFIAAGDALSARNALGLTNAATTATVQNAIDRTTGRIVTVGSFGSNGGNLDLRSTVYVSGTPQDVFGCGTLFGFVNGGTGADPATALSIPALGAGTYYGTLQVNSQYPDASGLQGTSRVFITSNGRTFTQVASSATTWGAWNETWNTTNLIKTNGRIDVTSDRILKTGDYGLGSMQPVPLNANNEADAVNLPSGFYEVSPTPTWTSRPINNTWTRIIHHSHDNPTGYASQYATAGFNDTANGNRFFNRTLIAGTWSPWVELYHSGNSSQLVAQVQAGIQPQLNAKQNALGYTPVQQGTGTGQLNNAVKIGWGANARLRLTVDNTDFSTTWPIDVNGQAATANKWSTPRNISLFGGASGTMLMDGSTDLSMGVTITNNGHTHTVANVTGLQAELDSTLRKTGVQTITANTGNITAGGQVGQLIVQPVGGSVAGQSAAITFHRLSVYAVNMGLSANTNEIVIGGYSMGAIEYPVLHTGNAREKLAPIFTGNGAARYTVLPNGVIIQWGAFTADGFVTFPIAFPNACGAVTQMQSGTASGSTGRVALNGNPAANGFNVTGIAQFPGALPARWMAIGY